MITAMQKMVINAPNSNKSAFSRIISFSSFLILLFFLCVNFCRHGGVEPPPRASNPCAFFLCVTRL